MVFYPAKKGNLLKPEIRNDFYIGYISQENFGEREGFYFAVIDKKNLVKVDLFMPERDVEIQDIKIGGKTYKCPIKEEIYLNVLRDFWYLTNAKAKIEQKWVHLLDFLENEGDLDQAIIEEIWPNEKKAIKYYCKQEAERKFASRNDLESFLQTVAYREFSSFKEYRESVRQSINENTDIIIPKKDKLLWDYPSRCPKAWGLEIEDKKTFESLKEKLKSKLR